MFQNDIAFRLPVVLIFGLIGYFLAKQFRNPHNQYIWLFVLGALVLVSFIGNDPWLVRLGGVAVPLKTTLSGALIGVLAGFVIHRRTTK